MTLKNFYESSKISLEKGCQVWDYLNDPGFDHHRNSKRLKMIIEPFKQRFFE